VTTPSERRNARAMREAEARALREPEPERGCNAACLGLHCTRRGDCPEPEKLTDALYDRGR
jgi:hypothetical protein